jgi:hypothetical protein
MGLRADVLNIGSVELNDEKNDVKSTALCVTAERLEGSPPPELPYQRMRLCGQRQMM